jgi:putative transposase
MAKKVDIDHMPLDLFIVDDKTGLPLGRPYLTVCIDERSRQILASQFSFMPPSTHSKRRLLNKALRKRRQFRRLDDGGTR